MLARAAANHKMPCKLYHSVEDVLVLSHELLHVVAFCVCHLIACTPGNMVRHHSTFGLASVRAGGCEETLDEESVVCTANICDGLAAQKSLSPLKSEP